MGEIFINRFERLESELEVDDIKVVAKFFKSKAKGLCNENKNKIGISKKINTNTERYCIAIEELGHLKLTIGDIIDQSNMNNRKQEKKARTYGYLHTIGVVDLINAYRFGASNRFEMAEYLEVTEEFLEEAIKTLGEKHGICCTFDKYTVYFNSFGIYKNFK